MNFIFNLLAAIGLFLIVLSIYNLFYFVETFETLENKFQFLLMDITGGITGLYLFKTFKQDITN